ARLARRQTLLADERAEVVGDAAESLDVQPVRVALGGQISQRRLGGRLRGAVAGRPDRGVQHLEAGIEAGHVDLRRQPDRAVAVQLDGPPRRDEVRRELADRVRREQPAGVLQVEAVDVRAVGERGRAGGVVRIRVHGAEGVREPDDDLLDPLLARDARHTPERSGIVRRLRELETADAVANDAAEGEAHHVLVARLPGDEAHARGDEVEGRLRQRRPHEADQLPWVLAMEPDGDGHVRARREVERMEADRLHRRRNCKDLAGGEAGGAPEALVAVARRRVDDLDRPRHAGSTRKRGWPYSTSCAFSTWTSAIVPTTPAGTEFIIFMTSMMQTIVSSSTRAPTSTKGGSPGAGAR